MKVGVTSVDGMVMVVIVENVTVVMVVMVDSCVKECDGGDNGECGSSDGECHHHNCHHHH